MFKSVKSVKTSTTPSTTSRPPSPPGQPQATLTRAFDGEGPSRESPLTGRTRTLNARDAPANTVITAGTRRKKDPQYDGAFVGASSRAYSSDGAVAEAWSAQTDWRQLSGTKPNNGRPV